jgi:hypothetical protein
MKEKPASIRRSRRSIRQKIAPPTINRGHAMRFSAAC